MKGLIQIVTVAVLMAAVILGPSIMAYAGSNAPEWVVRGSGAGEFRARRVFMESARPKISKINPAFFPPRIAKPGPLWRTSFMNSWTFCPTIT